VPFCRRFWGPSSRSADSASRDSNERSGSGLSTTLELCDECVVLRLRSDGVELEPTGTGDAHGRAYVNDFEVGETAID
jgi:hypothetical protein